MQLVSLATRLRRRMTGIRITISKFRLALLSAQTGLTPKHLAVFLGKVDVFEAATKLGIEEQPTAAVSHSVLLMEHCHHAKISPTRWS